MLRKTFYANSIIAIMALVALAVPAQAELLRFTFQGTGAVIDDPGNLLPFSSPSPDAVFTFSATIDVASGYVAETASPDFQLTSYYVADVILAFEGQTFGTNGGDFNSASATVANNMPLPDDPTLVGDFFSISALTLQPYIQPTGIETAITASFYSIFDPLLSSGPIDAASLFTPDPANWDTASITYDLLDLDNISPTTGSIPVVANMTVPINVVSVAPVPVPAAAWLFGSAFLGLVGLGRRHRQ